MLEMFCSRLTPHRDVIIFAASVFFCFPSSSQCFVSVRQYLAFEVSSPLLTSLALLSPCVSFLVSFGCMHTQNTWLGMPCCLELSWVIAPVRPCLAVGAELFCHFYFRRDTIACDCLHSSSLTQFHKSDLLGKKSSRSA